MSFQSLLNDTCTIYSRAEVIDSDTGEQTFTDTAVAENVPCALQHSGGGVDRQGRIITGDNMDRLYLLPQAFEITKQNHIVEVRGNKYYISEVTDLGGRKRFLRLNLTRVALDE